MTQWRIKKSYFFERMRDVALGNQEALRPENHVKNLKGEELEGRRFSIQISD
jgi:hypothetical protein